MVSDFPLCHAKIYMVLDLLLRSAGTKLISLIAMALKLDEDFFEKVGAVNEPYAFIRTLHYPGIVPIIVFFYVIDG